MGGGGDSSKGTQHEPARAGGYMRLHDLKPHMIITGGFTRIVVSRALATMRGAQDCRPYYAEAGRLLRNAIKSGEIRFILGGRRYYEFLNPNTDLERDKNGANP